MIHFLVHDAADNVGVAVVDLEPGTACSGRILADNSNLKARAEQAIPLGHKLALRDFSVGDTVILIVLVLFFSGEFKVLTSKKII